MQFSRFVQKCQPSFFFLHFGFSRRVVFGIPIRVPPWHLIGLHLFSFFVNFYVLSRC